MLWHFGIRHEFTEVHRQWKHKHSFSLSYHPRSTSSFFLEDDWMLTLSRVAESLKQRDWSHS